MAHATTFSDVTYQRHPYQSSNLNNSFLDHGNFYDAADTLSSKHLRGWNNVTQDGSPQANFEKPQQYAHPLQVSLLQTDRQPSIKTGAQRLDPSEHMLRRKTPNGTLAAGYDGTPVEWTTRPHAAKHFLMPASDHGSHTPYKAEAIQGCDEYIPVNRPSVLTRADKHQQQVWNQNTFSPRVQYGLGFAVDGDYTYVERGCHSLRSPGRDPNINDGLLSRHSHDPTAGQQVPTVLQPMWPPYIGPTASNDQGPFGPYWPDGAFVPYRPAAVRDPRYHVNSPQGNVEKSQSMHNCKGWAPVASQIGPSPNINSEVHNSLGIHDPLSPDDHLSPRINPYTQIGGQSLDKAAREVYATSSTQLAYRGKHPLMTLDTFHGSNTWNSSRLSSPTSSAHLRSPMRHGNEVYTSNLQFKEKTLIWAHRIYVNLLASLHQSRRQISNKSNLSNDSNHTRLSIYPKPPQQLHQISELSSSSRSVSAQLLRQPLQHGIASFLDQDRRQDTVFGSPENGSFPLGWAGHRDEKSQNSWQSEGLMSRLNIQSSNYCDTMPYNARSPVFSGFNGPQQQQTVSPTGEARAAFEMLGRLCQESGWRWIDGMLLGGCLAYGLGEYDKALQWYMSVLSCDQSNVEAMSNMAATLLSLNRRKEAEQYWLRSVKLRPCYFEAVEHLIGLLCGDQRHKEAVEIIESVEQALRQSNHRHPIGLIKHDHDNNLDIEDSRSPSVSVSEFSHTATSDNEFSDDKIKVYELPHSPDFASSGYAIPGSDNGRMLALVHAKGNMLYALGDNAGAAKAFEDAILISAGRRHRGIGGLIKRILHVFADQRNSARLDPLDRFSNCEPTLLLPEMALKTSHLVFPTHGHLPGLKDVSEGVAKKAAISTTSNSLLSLAKIYQDGMSSSGATAGGPKAASGVQDILALYYLSLSLQPSPSTANNVGILLASIQQSTPRKTHRNVDTSQPHTIPGVVPGSGIALALAYYNYGLNLDSRHAHLYTNLGSLLKDIGQLSAAIKMYEQAVACDENFDIALANLANAVKDQGRISDAIGYYKRAVTSNPDFAEAVCGLANALNSVCRWNGRGGVVYSDSEQDRWHVDEQGMLHDASIQNSASSGWIGRVVAIVEKQLNDGQSWGKGILHSIDINQLLTQCQVADGWGDRNQHNSETLMRALDDWAENKWEGAKVIRLVERATKRLGWQMYRDKYFQQAPCRPTKYARPQLPTALAAPSAPTVLPFHTFTCPLTAKQIRKISQRNGLRISCSTLRAPWLPARVFDPPAPPSPCLRVGYISSDFNNHPLAHLMQSVFGFHDTSRVKAFCYATTASDNSVHREQIQREAPVFHDASSWSIDRLVNRVVDDGIHILINLNGYTRGARNEVFAARPAPIQMSFMGFAGTLGAEWCDYLLADTTAVPPRTLRPWRRNVDLIDQTMDGNNNDDEEDWIYGENIIFTRDTFFCCDHRQSAPDAQGIQLNWRDEQKRRWKMRKEIFPELSDDSVILGNFNQLYKIEPTTFRTWLRILSRVPKAVLWLLRFPDLGESNLRQTAELWAGAEVAARIIFTDVAPKHQHISRARVCDLFLDTPECNAHTTAADVLWSGTPLLTLPRYEYKMCSRMAASILKGALPKGLQGDRAAKDLIVGSDEDYEEHAVELSSGLKYGNERDGRAFGSGRLVELRRLLYESRWTCALFDTRRWVRDLEEAYEEAWRRWVAGEGGDIWL